MIISVLDLIIESVGAQSAMIYRMQTHQLMHHLRITVHGSPEASGIAPIVTSRRVPLRCPVALVQRRGFDCSSVSVSHRDSSLDTDRACDSRDSQGNSRFSNHICAASTSFPPSP